MNDLIIVKQLPIIEEHLKKVSVEIDADVKKATSLVCNEDTCKDVKKVRAELNKKYEALEKKRKEVKSAVNEPYQNFEKVYKEYVSDKFKAADSILKNKIDDVEKEIKEEKEKAVKDFFDEYAEYLHIDFVPFIAARINVTMSASLKSLKEQAKSFLDRIADDLILIDSQEFKTEILVEYKKTLNVSLAITSVVDRKKAIEAEKQKAEELIPIVEAELEAEEKVEAIAPPVTIEEAPQAEEEYTLSFKVTATMEKLKALKAFLVEGGYKYE